MAKAWITRRWSDESTTTVGLEVDGQHPDLLDELVRRVIALDHEACPDDAEADAPEGD